MTSEAYAPAQPRPAEQAPEVPSSSASAESPPLRSRARKRRLWLCVWFLLPLTFAELLWIQSLDYHQFFPDDAYISLRYSQRWLRGSGLTWTDGERVEGYSNFLWVALVALGGLFSENLMLVARVLGALLVGTVPLAIFLAYAPRRFRDLLPPTVASSFLVLAGPIQAYSVGGLEQALLIAELGWALCLSYRLLEQARPRPRSWLPVSALLAAITLTRPDGFVLVAGAIAGIVLVRGLNLASFATGARLARAPALALAGQLLFRRLYYQDWFPNTYYAKVAWTEQRLRAGWEYVSAGYAANAVLLAALGIAVWVSSWDRLARGRLLLVASITLPWLVYVVFIGGDFFAQHRHLVVALCTLSILSAEATRVLLGWGALQALATTVLAAGALFVFGKAHRADPAREIARNDIFHTAGVETGRMLRLAFADRRPLLAVDAAGCMPYHYELPSLDMLGLSDRYLAHHRPKDLGTQTLGHELGDGAYVLSRKPDIVVFGYPQGLLEPMWRGGREMYDDPRFAKEYKLVKFMTLWPHEYDGNFFLRLAGRIGVERSATQVNVPGYLLYAPGTLARPNGQNRILLEIPPTVSGTLSDLALPGGRQRVVVDASEAVGVSLSWEDQSGPRSARFNATPFEVDLGPYPTSVTISVQPLSDRAVALERVGFCAGDCQLGANPGASASR